MRSWKTSFATGIWTRERTSRIASLMLLLTLSSHLIRESVSLLPRWTSVSGRGLITRSYLAHSTAAHQNGRRISSQDRNKSKTRSLFQNQKSTDRLRLTAFAYEREYGGKSCNYYKYRNNRSIYYRDHKIKNCSQKRTFSRNVSVNTKDKNQGEYVSKENDNDSGDKNSEKETFVNVLSIDPEHVEIYERTDEILTVTENGKGNIVTNSNPFLSRNFIDMFRGSANYIASHRNTLVVFHLPGDLMDKNPVGFRDLMNDISLSWLLGMKIVIVAGCRYEINERHKKRNKVRQEHMGMVVTDQESLRIVKEEAGYVRFEVERQLARALKNGSSGKRSTNGKSNANENGSDGSDFDGGNVVSGNFYSAQPFGVLDGVDYQYSGFVRRMEVKKIHQVHQNRDIVLLTSLGFSPTGEVFNVNSEHLAAHAAGELKASKVIYFLEKNAALRHKVHGSDIPHLRINDGRNLLDLNGVKTRKKGFVYMDGCPFDDGPEQMFLVKMGWGMNALRAGVKRVHLISPYDGALLQELYTRDGSGTMISGDLYDGIQCATVNDVAAIYEVITPLVEKGTLVERTKAELERDIDQYHVYTRDGLLIACGQLKMFEDGYAEFGCLVVNPLYRAKGRGDAMLGYLERLCVQNGATKLFVLSTQTMEWFVERGFHEACVEHLPPSRQATYNHVRASKIYMKKITSLRDLDESELFWDR